MISTFFADTCAQSGCSPYGNHQYRLGQIKTTWAEAKSQCKQDGGHLASIHSEAEHNFILTLIGRLVSSETIQLVGWLSGEVKIPQSRMTETCWETLKQLFYEMYGTSEKRPSVPCVCGIRLPCFYGQRAQLVL